MNKIITKYRVRDMFDEDVPKLYNDRDMAKSYIRLRVEEDTYFRGYYITEVFGYDEVNE